MNKICQFLPNRSKLKQINVKIDDELAAKAYKILKSKKLTWVDLLTAACLELVDGGYCKKTKSKK